MMRTILIAILLLCTAVLGAEAEWTPSAAISLQYSGSVFTDGGNPGHDLWSSTRTSAELDAASFRLGCHMISAPVSISYISEGGMHGRLVMTDAFSAMLSIRYGLMLFITDSAVLEIGVSIMKYIVPWYITYIAIELLSGAIRGVGKSLIPTLISVFGICVLRIVWIYVSPAINPTLFGVLFSYPFSWVVTSLLFIIYYFRGHIYELPKTTH